MKLLLAAAFVVSALVSAPSHASHFGEYTDDQMNLVNKLFKLCPKEVSDIMSRPYTNMTSGEYVGGMQPDLSVGTTYTFNFIESNPAPSFQTTSIILTARETIKTVARPTVPDAPGIMRDVTCDVEEVDNM
jgi:hypothetical protein